MCVAQGILENPGFMTQLPICSKTTQFEDVAWYV